MDRNLRSNTVMLDRTELASIVREVIREEIGTGFDLKLQPIQQSIDSLQEIMKSTSSKLREFEEVITDNDHRFRV